MSDQHSSASSEAACPSLDEHSSSASSDEHEQQLEPSQTATSSKQQQFFDDQGNPISKSKYKRLLRQERARQHRKEVRKQKKQKRKQQAAADESGSQPPAPKRRRVLHKLAGEPLKFVIDCEWDAMMTDKEIYGLVQQLNYCYSAMSKRQMPIEMYVSGFGGKSKQFASEKFPPHERWKNVHFEQQSYEQLFDTDTIVYLTSESPDVLETITTDQVYIIGGIVDHNRLKGVTYERAKERGIRTAQLPIGEYLQMQTRRVLTINHVAEILMEYMSVHDWKSAFLNVLPKRKFAQVKDGADASPTHGDTTHDETAEEEEEQTRKATDCCCARQQQEEQTIEEEGNSNGRETSTEQQQEAEKTR